jgi:hypothetical protein
MSDTQEISGSTEENNDQQSQTEVAKVKKQRKSPNLAPPKVIGTDKNGREIWEGPGKGKYIETVSKTGNRRRYYLERDEGSKTIKKTRKTPDTPAGKGRKRKAEKEPEPVPEDDDEVISSEEETHSQAAEELTQKLQEEQPATRRVRRKTLEGQ